MSDRRYRILSGAITMLFIVGAVYFGVKVRAAGALRPVFQVNASFDAAGQGLQPQSDVKVHGVTIGRVRHVSLRAGRAFVRMDIDRGQRVPTDVTATIRPKTLFGEKFVDLDPGDPAHERRGPFLRDEGRITRTVGGFELEKVLTELYPILRAVRPEELSTILGTLAGGARGEGAAVNRQIVNWDALSKVMAQHDADTRRFLD